jgi:hypothetical protein
MRSRDKYRAVTVPLGSGPTAQGNLRRSLPHDYLAVAAAGIAWLVSANRIGPSTLWEGDYRAVQGLLHQSLGTDGLVSAVLARIVAVIPLGTFAMRLGLLSAAACALIAWLCFVASRRLLHTVFEESRVDPWLSLGAAIAFALCPAVLAASTRTPGPMVAVALLLTTALVCDRRVKTSVGHEPNSEGLLLGLLVAITALERVWAGAFAFGLVALAEFTVPRVNLRRRLAVTALTVAGTAFVLWIPWFVTRRKSWSVAITKTLPRSSAFEGWTIGEPQHRLSSLLDELGPLLLVACAGGLVALLLRRRLRRGSLPLLLVIPYAILEVARLRDDDLGEGLLICGLCGLTTLAALGLRAAIHWTSRGLPNRAALASVLAVILQATLAFAKADEASYRVDRYGPLGMEVFTDEAFGNLPARSVLLLRDPRLYRRVKAAQIAEHLRPDLLTVPLDAATNPAVVADLLGQEPALAAVLRELAINGRPSEFALSALSDERPVYLEFDPTWDLRLREHLLPLPFLSRIYSQSLGRSDRAPVLGQSQQQLTRAFRALSDGKRLEVDSGDKTATETTTRSVLQSRVEEQISLLAEMGDSRTVEALLADFEDFVPQREWSPMFRRRLGSKYLQRTGGNAPAPVMHSTPRP